MHEKQRHHVNRYRNGSSFVSRAGCLTDTDYPFWKGVTDPKFHGIAECTVLSTCLRRLNIFVKRYNHMCTIIDSKYCVTVQKIGIIICVVTRDDRNGCYPRPSVLASPLLENVNLSN
jgi:hypothetical protein